MTIFKSPCNNCPDRHTACWDNCDKYKEFRVEANKVRAEKEKFYADEYFAILAAMRKKKGQSK